VIDRFVSFWVRYQRVIAPLKTLRQLMDLQFDFYASVKFLNHVALISSRLSARSSTVFLQSASTVYFPYVISHEPTLF